MQIRTEDHSPCSIHATERSRAESSAREVMSMEEQSRPGKTDWWHTLPGVLTAVAGVITASTGLIVVLHQTGWFASKDTISAGGEANPAQQSSPVPSSGTLPSKDIDHPKRLTSPAIAGGGVARDVSHYYSFYAGPGSVVVTVRARNEKGYSANALGLEITKRDGTSLTRIHLGYSAAHKTESSEFVLGERDQVLMRVDLDRRTTDYKMNSPARCRLNRTRTRCASPAR